MKKLFLAALILTGISMFAPQAEAGYRRVLRYDRCGHPVYSYIYYDDCRYRSPVYPRYYGGDCYPRTRYYYEDNCYSRPRVYYSRPRFSFFFGF